MDTFSNIPGGEEGIVYSHPSHPRRDGPLSARMAKTALRLFLPTTHTNPATALRMFRPHFFIRIKNAPFGALLILAEKKGFEPLIRLPVYTISSRAHSTTLPLLRCRTLYRFHFFLQGFILTFYKCFLTCRGYLVRLQGFIRDIIIIMNDILDIFDNIKWTAAFEVTRYCNMKCDICGINSGPNAPFRFLDTARINNILTQMRKMPKFGRSFILSGGEVTTAYAYDGDYINRLLQMGRDLKLRCTIRTNGKVPKAHLAQLSKDLVPFVEMGRRAYKWLRIGLSLDNSHKGSFEYNLRLINKLSGDLGLEQKVFFIVSVGESSAVLTELADRLNLPVLRRDSDGFIYKIGQIDVQNEIQVYNAGRAAENNIANVPESNLADTLNTINQGGRQGMIWFSVNNTASFIYNFNTLLSTPLQDANGTDKSLPQIMTDLRNQCALQLNRTR